MASGRVGGTSSKKSGVLGSEVYRVVKNPDGSYSQIVQSKGVQTINRTTPRLQAQRMCMAMVESLMRDLKEIAKISFQSGANASKSLNAFSAYNVQLVARDCKAHWFDSVDFAYPFAQKYGEIGGNLGGRFMISAGTLNRNLFRRLIYIQNAAVEFPQLGYGYVDFYGIEFKWKWGMKTLGEVLQYNGMTFLDKICFAGFFEGIYFKPWEDEGIAKGEHRWVIASVNPALSAATAINRNTLSSIFSVKSSGTAVVLPDYYNSRILIGFVSLLEQDTESCRYWAGFSVSYLDGKKRVSASQYESPDGSTTPWALDQEPSKVFGTWMDEPWIKNYPNIFAL